MTNWLSSPDAHLGSHLHVVLIYTAITFQQKVVFSWGTNSDLHSSLAFMNATEGHGHTAEESSISGVEGKKRQKLAFATENEIPG